MSPVKKKTATSRKPTPTRSPEARPAKRTRAEAPAPPKRAAAAAEAPADPRTASAPKPKKKAVRDVAPTRSDRKAVAPRDALPEERSPRAVRPKPEPEVVEQIRELEAQLDRLIDEASRRDVSSLATDDEPEEDEAPWGVPLAPPTPAPPTASELRRPVARPSGPLPSVQDESTTVFDTARELLGADFYLRKWGRLAMRGRSEEVDDFGFDPTYDAKMKPLVDFLYTKYFRVETTGIEHVPAQGRCLLVANHSGTVPLDGVMLKAAVKREHPEPRDVRWLTEDFIYHFPYLGSMMNRLGAVRACQENAERLLANEELVCVFPEGVKGIGKLFAERYRLQRFGRGGFIKLCLRMQTPIVPVAVIGAEETNPMLFKTEYFSKLLGLPYLPVTATFPLLGPAGLLPAPTKWHVQFGEPIDFSAHGPEAADDDLLVGKLAERVRATIQGMLDRGVGARKSVFFG